MEYMNLVYAFSYAGAPSVIATLWRVPDTATSALMSDLYHNINNGQSYAAALSNAQRAFLRRDSGLTSVRSWGGVLAFGRP